MGLVREFHEAFDLPILSYPTIPAIQRVELRRRLIQEEYREVDVEFERIVQRLASGVHNPGGYSRAIQVYEDIARLAKELSDVRYVVEGAELEFGIPGEAVYAEVHASNMSKLGPDGRPVRRHDGKVLKGPNYRHADVLSAIGIIEGETFND
jgi:predicted HAD superfamily Cof-like phosphohydrolase